MSDLKHKGEAGKIQDEIIAAQRALDAAKSKLSNLAKTCQHKWGEVQYDPINHPGYSYEGDPPGTMGVDWRPGGYVSARIEKRWTRTCTECGYVQETKNTKTEHRFFPGGISGNVDAPIFGTIW